MRKATILIVEDEAIVSADIAGKLRKLGYEVVGATDTGEEAIEIARRLRPSLVLMDVRLAGGNGRHHGSGVRSGRSAGCRWFF